ncbi:hypothetical protein C8J57DRAFT_1613743 [Mycena rebaudengoi]|nr:hypothetical protein C8J57DRAFT_1613743 [Mycena rebaudengoi]
MPPLTRQQTLESLRSWWSDSNSNLRGPTINLHAAAKPLMRLLYDRQVLDFIRDNWCIPLSAGNAEIYGSYLLCGYVSALTKSAILKDLYERSRAQSESGALEVHAHLFHDFVQLLEGPVPIDTRMLVALQRILWALATCEATVEATCGSLVALLCDSRVPQVVEGVLVVLSDGAPYMKFLPITSRASIQLLERLLDMLEDSSTAEWHYPWILQIVSTMALHEPTAVAIVETNVLNSVEKLRRSRPDLRRHIFSILEPLASHESTAMAVVRIFPLHLAWDSSAHHESSAIAIVETNVPKSIENLPGFWRTHLHWEIHSVLSNLVSHESTATAVDKCHLLATLWREHLDANADTYITAQVIDTLARIASFPGGAEGLLSTCKLLRALIGHESTVQAVIAAVPREDIVALSRYGSHLSSMTAKLTFLAQQPGLQGSQVCSRDIARIRHHIGKT